MDEEEDSTDTDEYEDRHRILGIPIPSGRCPRQTWSDFQNDVWGSADWWIYVYMCMYTHTYAYINIQTHACMSECIY